MDHDYSLFFAFFPKLFIIHFKFFRDIHYSFFSLFASIFLSKIFYNAILYIGYQKFTFQYTFNLVFSKYQRSIHVVKIMLSFSINRPCLQLLEREGPKNSSLITLSTKKIITNKQTIAETNTFHNRNRLYKSTWFTSRAR